MYSDTCSQCLPAFSIHSRTVSGFTWRRRVTARTPRPSDNSASAVQTGMHRRLEIEERSSGGFRKKLTTLCTGAFAVSFRAPWGKCQISRCRGRDEAQRYRRRNSLCKDNKDDRSGSIEVALVVLVFQPAPRSPDLSSLQLDFEFGQQPSVTLLAPVGTVGFPGGLAPLARCLVLDPIVAIFRGQA